jgi:hypothetical protein
MMDWAVVIAAGSLELVILSSAIGVVWKLTRTEIALRGEFERKQAEIQAKIYQVEIWSRDEFVRKGSFELVVARLEKTMEMMGAKIETAVDKMATKVDNLQQAHHHRD